MLELRGRYGEALIYTDVVDQESISQVMLLLNQPFSEGAHIRMMPDIHAGAGCTIGTTMRITDKVCPNLVGVDISCGMETVRLSTKQSDFDLDRLDKFIHESIPAGFNIRTKRHFMTQNVELEKLRCKDHVNLDKAYLSLGTLGGGNHFIEVDKDENGLIYLVIHSGSRHLGLEVANYYQRMGYECLNHSDEDSVRALIARLKAEGKQRQIETEVKKLKNTKSTSIPKDLAYVEGRWMDDYLHDMRILSDFARNSRKAMAADIMEHMGVFPEDCFTTVHNYIDVDDMILRKGSVSAQKGERLLIPINMRDGSLICVGKGNPEWNYSAPHGAGRLMSRGQAKRELTVEEYAHEMLGIYSTCVNQSTLDESPMAYKSMNDIVDNIGPTADIVSIIKPIYNFKAGD